MIVDGYSIRQRGVELGLKKSITKVLSVIINHKPYISSAE